MPHLFCPSNHPLPCQIILYINFVNITGVVPVFLTRVKGQEGEDDGEGNNVRSIVSTLGHCVKLKSKEIRIYLKSMRMCYLVEHCHWRTGHNIRNRGRKREIQLFWKGPSLSGGTKENMQKQLEHS